MTLEIYTYGSGAFIAQIFEVVKLLISGGLVFGLLKVFAIIGFLMMIIMSSLKLLHMGSTESITSADPVASMSAYGFVILIQRAFYAAIAVYLLLNPLFTANVLVIDRMNANNDRAVTGVPYPLAYAAHASSLIGDTIGQFLDDFLSPVDAVKIRNGGLAIGPRALNEIFNIQPPGFVDANKGSIKVVTTEWYERCIYPYFAQVQPGTSTSNGLVALTTSDHLLDDTAFGVYPFNQVNTTFNSGLVSGTTLTCMDAASQIKAAWGLSYNKWISKESAHIFNVKDDDPALVATVLELVDRYFPNSPLSSQDKLIQLAVLNTAYPALMNFNTRYGVVTGTDFAQRQQGGAWLEMARMAPKSLMMIRQLCEGGVYLYAAFLPAFFALSGIGAIAKFVKMVFWLALWVPFFVLLNCFADMAVARVVETISDCGSGVCTTLLNFGNLDKLRMETSQILGYIGVLSLSVPGLAWGTLKGGEAALGGAVGALSGAASASAVGSVGSASIGTTTQDQVNKQFTSSTTSGSRFVEGTGERAASSLASGSQSFDSYIKADLISRENKVGYVAAIQKGQNNAYNDLGRDTITQATQNKTAFDAGSGIGIGKNGYNLGKNEGERKAAIGEAQIDWTNKMAGELMKNDKSLSPEAAHHKAQSMMGEMDFTLTGKGTYMAAMKTGKALGMSAPEAVSLATVTDKQLAMGSSIEQTNQFGKNGIDISKAGAANGAWTAGQTVGKITGATDLLKSMGKPVTDDAINKAAADGAAGNAAMSLLKGTGEGEAIKLTGASNIKDSATVGVRKAVAGNQAFDEATKSYAVAHNMSYGDAAKEMQRTVLANTESLLNSTGSAAGARGYLGAGIAMKQGEILGMQDLAKELGTNLTGTTRAMTTIQGQGFVGLQKLMDDKVITKEGLQNEKVMSTLGSMMNPATMISKGKAGDTETPRSLFDKDGTMNEQRAQLWVANNAKAADLLEKKTGVGTSSSYADSNISGSAGVSTGKLIPGFNAGVQVSGRTGIDARSTNQSSYDQNVRFFSSVVNQAKADAKTGGVAEAASNMAATTQRYYKELQHNNATTESGAGKIIKTGGSSPGNVGFGGGGHGNTQAPKAASAPKTYGANGVWG